MTTVLGVLTAANALSGGRLFNAAKKNVGKFVGKIGKKGIDKLLSENSKKKLNKWIEDKTGVVEKVMGDDSEITRNLKNFSSEMKGKETEWRRYDDQDEKDDKKETGLNFPDETGPYIRNLGGTNYQRYVPRHHRFYRQSRRWQTLKRPEVQRHSKFGMNR